MSSSFGFCATPLGSKRRAPSNNFRATGLLCMGGRSRTVFDLTREASDGVDLYLFDEFSHCEFCASLIRRQFMCQSKSMGHFVSIRIACKCWFMRQGVICAVGFTTIVDHHRFRNIHHFEGVCTHQNFVHYVINCLARRRRRI